MDIYGSRVRVTNDFVIVRMWGTFKDKEFFADLFFEIDGRDFDVEVLWGSLDDTTDILDALYESPKWPEIEAAMTEARS